MSKFKVGDKVKVVRKFPCTEDGLGWNPCMNNTVGEIGTVIKWNTFTKDDRCRVVFEDGEDWTYLDCVLELVSDEPTQEDSIKVHLEKVGDVCKFTVEGKLSQREIESLMNVVYGYCGEAMAEEFVTIPKQEYDDLLETQRWLNCLENAGVDNWHGYDYACEMYHNEENE